MNIVTDMDESSQMRLDALEKAQDYLGHADIQESEISEKIKHFFDEKYQPNWHCIIGKDFYSSFSYESQTFIFFYIGQIAVLLYKQG